MRKKKKINQFVDQNSFVDEKRLFGLASPGSLRLRSSINASSPTSRSSTDAGGRLASNVGVDGTLSSEDEPESVSDEIESDELLPLASAASAVPRLSCDDTLLERRGSLTDRRRPDAFGTTRDPGSDTGLDDSSNRAAGDALAGTGGSSLSLSLSLPSTSSAYTLSLLSSSFSSPLPLLLLSYDVDDALRSYATLALPLPLCDPSPLPSALLPSSTLTDTNKQMKEIKIEDTFGRNDKKKRKKYFFAFSPLAESIFINRAAAAASDCWSSLPASSTGWHASRPLPIKPAAPLNSIKSLVLRDATLSASERGVSVRSLSERCARCRSRPLAGGDLDFALERRTSQEKKKKKKKPSENLLEAGLKKVERVLARVFAGHDAAAGAPAVSFDVKKFERFGLLKVFINVNGRELISIDLLDDCARERDSPALMLAPILNWRCVAGKSGSSALEFGALRSLSGVSAEATLAAMTSDLKARCVRLIVPNINGLSKEAQLALKQGKLLSRPKEGESDAQKAKREASFRGLQRRKKRRELAFKWRLRGFNVKLVKDELSAAAASRDAPGERAVAKTAAKRGATKVGGARRRVARRAKRSKQQSSDNELVVVSKKQQQGSKRARAAVSSDSSSSSASGSANSGGGGSDGGERRQRRPKRQPTKRQRRRTGSDATTAASASGGGGDDGRRVVGKRDGAGHWRRQRQQRATRRGGVGGARSSRKRKKQSTPNILDQLTSLFAANLRLLAGKKINDAEYFLKWIMDAAAKDSEKGGTRLVRVLLRNNGAKFDLFYSAACGARSQLLWKSPVVSELDLSTPKGVLMFVLEMAHVALLIRAQRRLVANDGSNDDVIGKLNEALAAFDYTSIDKNAAKVHTVAVAPSPAPQKSESNPAKKGGTVQSESGFAESCRDALYPLRFENLYAHQAGHERYEYAPPAVVWMAEKTNQVVKMLLLPPGGDGDARMSGIMRELRMTTLASASGVAPALHQAVRLSEADMQRLVYVPGGAIALFMERGQTLREWSESGRHRQLSLRQVCGLFERVALFHAHSVHGDIKPDNIVIMADESVRLIDFGTAVPLLPHGVAFVPPFNVTTPGYTAPELASARAAVPLTPAVDSFSLGCTLHEMLGEQMLKLPRVVERQVREIVAQLTEDDAARRLSTAAAAAKLLHLATADNAADGQGGAAAAAESRSQ